MTLLLLHIVLNKPYLIGGIIAFLILGYLAYSLIRPEKF